MSEHSGWIRPENLPACLSLLASLGEVPVPLGETLLKMFQREPGTTGGSGQEYELSLGKLLIAVTRDKAGEVQVRVQAPHGFGRAVQIVLQICDEYQLG